jgi:hypothetical protein
VWNVLGSRRKYAGARGAPVDGAEVSGLHTDERGGYLGVFVVILHSLAQ